MSSEAWQFLFWSIERNQHSTCSQTMSRTMAQAFLPATFDRLVRHQQRRRGDEEQAALLQTPLSFLSWLVLYALLPASADEACPEVVVEDVGMVLRNWAGDSLVHFLLPVMLRRPVLLLVAIGGIGIGGWGVWKFGGQRWWRKTHRGSTTGSGTFENPTTHSNAYLCVAFAGFGLMNLCAVVLHCLSPSPAAAARPSYPYSDAWFWWLGDVYTTGVSASSLAAASLECLARNRSNHSSPANRRWILRGWTLCQTVGLACLGWFLVSTADDTETNHRAIAPTHPLEFWYAVPIAMAAPPVALVMIRECSRETVTHSSHRRQSRMACALLAMGAAMAVLGILGDRWVCPQHDRALLRDALAAPTLVFGACDVAFVGICRGFPPRRPSAAERGKQD